MKSSTLHRSNLSKERMVLLEELRSKSARKSDEQNNTPGVYIRPSKEKELDVLWQNFKVNQKEEKSPGVYLTVGFLAGALSMFLMTALLSFSSNSISSDSDSPRLIKRKPAKSQLSIIPADTVNHTKAATSETYTIKSGDTLEGIVIRFWGKYDPSKVTKILNANKMTDPNTLSIGQTLTIPLD